MGTNVVRLVRIDHRRITELLSRLDGHYRPDANLPARIASELSAHTCATTSELLPFAEVRVDKLDGRCRDGLDSLVEIAAEFDRSAEPIPAERAHHAITAFREHVDAEEEDMLQPLEAAVPVPRLRTAGDAFRRARGVDRVAASSQRELADLVLLGVRRRRVEVIPNGVDTDLFTPAGRRHGSTRPTPPRLVAAGPLTRATGFETAIRALPGIPGAELMIAGGPPAGHGDGWTLTTDPEFNRLQTLADELGVTDRARLTELPGRHDLSALLHSADIVVSTPGYDAPGTVEIEAMACGRPVVGTAVGDLVDVVLESTTGVLVRPNDPPALAHAINEMLSDAVRMEGYAFAAVERARTRHSWPRITEEITGGYERALAN